MNERIRQLAEQAGFTEGGYESDEGPWIGPEFNKEKFAQLIVQECVDIANKQFSAVSELDDRDCWTAAEMKKHFGVEE